MRYRESHYSSPKASQGTNGIYLMMSRNPTSSFSPKIGQLIEQNPNCGLRDSSKNNRHVSHKADHDDECRFELFLLDEGQQKVEEKAETRKYNTTSPHIRPSQD